MMSHNEFNCSYLETFFQKFQHQNLNVVAESYDTGTPIDTTDRVYGVNCRRDAKSTTISATTNINSGIEFQRDGRVTFQLLSIS